MLALAAADIDNDGQQELIVGSEDSVLQVFKGEDMMFEVHEADRITGLCGVGPVRFAYSLGNGTSGW